MSAERTSDLDEDTAARLLEIVQKIDALDRRLAAIAEQIDVRTAETIEEISGYSPHLLRDFEQKRGHGVMYAPPRDGVGENGNVSK